MSEYEKNAEDIIEDQHVESQGDSSQVDADQQTDEDIHLLLEDARNKADEHWNELLRVQAELENLRKRNARDVENAHKFGMEKFIQEMLPVWDSQAMAVEAGKDDNINLEKLREGMELTLKMMNQAMEKFNLEEINPLGETFNPEFHQAMSTVPSEDKPNNTVINVFQKGYILNGRLIRPAMVVVAKSTNSDNSAGKIDEQA
jgi:molecular chaperone GrpE